jgi:hypothetical protein
VLGARRLTRCPCDLETSAPPKVIAKWPGAVLLDGVLSSCQSGPAAPRDWRDWRVACAQLAGPLHRRRFTPRRPVPQPASGPGHPQAARAPAAASGVMPVAPLRSGLPEPAGQSQPEARAGIAKWAPGAGACGPLRAAGRAPNADGAFRRQSRRAPRRCRGGALGRRRACKPRARRCSPRSSSASARAHSQCLFGGHQAAAATSKPACSVEASSRPW